ncbi:MAG: glycosyltransferase family 2 protein [Chlamydiales bacterium]
MNIPLLSVVIPNFNHAAYLPQNIDAILAQGVENMEIIIGDDASSDNSRAVIEKYAKQENRIRPFFFPKNRGVMAVCIDLYAEAKGKYIHFLSADDFYLPGFLRQTLQLLEDNPSIPFAFSDIRYFQSDHPEIYRDTHLHPSSKPTIFSAAELPAVCKETGFWIAGVSCVMKREIYQKYGPMDPKLENICDWFFFHKVALFEGVGYVPGALVAMRETPSSYTNKVKRDSKRRKATYWRVLEILTKPENRELKRRFQQSGLLIFVFENLFWRVVWRPQWWSFFHYTQVKARLSKSLRKRLCLYQEQKIK